MANIRLTPPQVELLTDIAINPHMFLGINSRWRKTGVVLRRLGLAALENEGPNHVMITITEAGRREAERRGLVTADHEGNA